MSFLADTTDDEGRYVFPGIPQDIYSIEAKGLVDGARLLIEHVEVKQTVSS